MTTLRVVATGGAGYIGSHICAELLGKDHDVLIIDDFSNSDPEVINRLENITGRRPDVVRLDLANSNCQEQLNEAVAAFRPDATIHLAGLKAVGESHADPVRYYHTNIEATLNLVRALEHVMSKRIVFSSSATVYGDRNKNPISENDMVHPVNPYGRTKCFIEKILTDVASTDQSWSVCNLRYFNPVGAHPSGLIGEDPHGIPNNLFPFIAQVAVGRRPVVRIFGDDYPTRDGSGIRDYIHVCDLARGHVSALLFAISDEGKGVSTFNLGTGVGYSVKEVVQAFELACGRSIAYEIVDRRSGDIAEFYACSDLALERLGWRAEKGLADMCVDHWNWQMKNPYGYAS